MYFDPISSRSALVAASKSSKRFTSDWSIRDSSPKPGDAILESTGEIDFVTMSRIFVGTVGLLAPGSPFKCWSSNLCEKKKQSSGYFGQNHHSAQWIERLELGSREFKVGWSPVREPFSKRFFFCRKLRKSLTYLDNRAQTWFRWAT